MSVRTLRFPAAVTLLLLAVVTAVALSACGTPDVPEGPPGIVGRVVTADKLDGGEYSILVVGAEQPAGAVSDKAMCRITGETTIVDAAGSEIGPDRLAVGETVAVWFTGAVAESYPVQGTAGYVQVRQAAE
jgi:hypothetical protein